jgi:sialate O-acetylesterase
MRLNFFARSCRLLLIVLIGTISMVCHGSVRLPKLISDGMVLQRDAKVALWGWADPGEAITVSINNKTYKATAAADGSWRLRMNEMKAGGPYQMVIKGQNTITLKDIMIGDVWFCSGQSNMVLNMERVKERYPQEIKGASFPAIRNFLVPTYSDVTKTYSDLPGGKWVVTSPETIFEFGAVAWFFAKALYEKHKVPIGIINASVGGTPAEAWISEDGLKEFPDLYSAVGQFKDTAYVAGLMKKSSIKPTTLPTDPDKGIEEKWSDVDLDTKRWEDFWLPGYWEDQGVKSLRGTVWFRKEIFVPDSLVSRSAKLFLGRIIDADVAYVNGVKVGNTTYKYPPRRYQLPSGLLKPGRNVIVVQVTNTTDKGGFVPDKPYYLALGNERIDLRGTWKYRVGSVFPKAEPEPPKFSAQNSPTGLYNTMVHPEISYTIKGFTWYQGEANTSRPNDYAKLLRALIADWRKKWGQGDLPFAFAQLANFMEVQYLPMESNWAKLRDEQRKALTVTKTAMAVTIDAGEWNDIHPLNKKTVGERLALAMDYLAYGDPKIVYSGPLYQSKQISGNKIVITFSNTGSGLVTSDRGEPQYFEIAGQDGKYVNAKALIEGDKVVVWSDLVAAPISVRYAWADNPARANVYNVEGLPASPFETER